MKSHAGTRSLREIAQESGLSHSSLVRIANSDLQFKAFLGREVQSLIVKGINATECMQAFEEK